MSHIYEQAVVWRDLDAYAHVNNAVYATYLENARLAFLGALSQEAGENFQVILAEHTIRYRSQAHLSDRLLIETSIREVRNSSFVMVATIKEATEGRLVVESEAILVHFDYENGRPIPVGTAWRERLLQGPAVPSTR
ncbi:MAG TPA: thioesterase family protein [Symbiobacteriaceae bacterium]|nr:thioesterase family protein [Symbiobacteriaceae bacterium]